jgi:FdhD protein
MDMPTTLSSCLPRLTQARAALTHEVEVLDELGQRRRILIPAERALTLYIDKRELVTLMTLGEAPEALVIGYLRNMGLIAAVDELESVTVDWDVSAAAVKTRNGIDALEHKTARRVVTTGCGQGTVFGDLMAHIDTLRLPPPQRARIRVSTLYAMLETMRQRDSVHRRAGSVHGCALFRERELLLAVEDVGRHNAVDTIAGWMWLRPGQAAIDGADAVFYTTGRLTSEMVVKAARMGVPIIVSRNGVTQSGLELAARLGMTLFGRAVSRRFTCYSGFERVDFDAEPRPARALALAPAEPDLE